MPSRAGFLRRNPSESSPSAFGSEAERLVHFLGDCEIDAQAFTINPGEEDTGHLLLNRHVERVSTLIVGDCRIAGEVRLERVPGAVQMSTDLEGGASTFPREFERPARSASDRPIGAVSEATAYASDRQSRRTAQGGDDDAAEHSRPHLIPKSHARTLSADRIERSEPNGVRHDV